MYFISKNHIYFKRNFIMKRVTVAFFSIVGLMAFADSATAGGTHDVGSFYAIQRGYGFGRATVPIAPAAIPLWNGNGYGGNGQVSGDTAVKAQSFTPETYRAKRHGAGGRHTRRS